MYRKILFLLFVVSPMVVLAYGPDFSNQDQNYGYSISEQNTGGVFTNQIDAAFNAKETTSGPGFTTLERPYIFGGVDNPQNLTNIDSSTPFFAGFYFPGNLPFSLYVKINHTSFGTQSEIETVGLNVRTYDILGYNVVTDQFQALVKIGPITTGLRYILDLDENRTVGNDYTDVGATPNVVNDMNGSESIHGFYIPAFFQTGNISHFAELGFAIGTKDNSNRNDIANTNYTDKLTVIRPQIQYEILIPLLDTLNEMNQLRARVIYNMSFFNETASGDIVGVSTPVTRTTPINFDIKANVEQALYFDSVDWVTLGFIPTVNYNFSKVSAGPESVTTSGVTTTYGKDYTITSTISFSFPTAVEFLPDKWVFGFLLGVTPTFSHSTNTTYDDVAALLQTTQKTWTTAVAHSYGIFIPIPGGFRMDVTLSVNGLWDFDNLSMQLIVPLQ